MLDVLLRDPLVLVLLAIRSRQPLLRSTPSRLMLLTTGAVLTLALLLVQSGAGRWMGLSPLPPLVLFALAGITLTYVATVDWLKLRLYGITDPHVPAAYVEARSELRKRSDRGEPANDA